MPTYRRCFFINSIYNIGVIADLNRALDSSGGVYIIKSRLVAPNAVFWPPRLTYVVINELYLFIFTY